VMNKMNLYGIDDWETLAASIRKVPHVVAVSPALYTPVMLSGAVTPTVVILKGIDVKQGLAVSDTLRHLKAGSLDRLRDADVKPPGLIVGKPLMEETGITLDSNIKVVSPEGELTPFGPQPAIRLFRVSGIYETGFYDIDDHWAYASIPAVQKALSLNDVINQLEIKVDNIDRAPEIAKDIERVTGSRYTTTTWQEQNRQLFSALHMERLVTVIVISLIELVAALNIFITLVMLVMEKYRDIAVLMSMGARHQQIRRIFMMQGVLIGVVGSGIGLALGYSLSYFANRYRWIPLQQSVYSMSFVPFEAHWIDGLWIAALAVLVSFLATLYPARNATRIAPAEVLRYE